MTKRDEVPDIETLEDNYRRALYLRSGIFNNKLHFNDTVFPTWIEDSDKFWYERTIKTGHGKNTKLGK